MSGTGEGMQLQYKCDHSTCSVMLYFYYYCCLLCTLDKIKEVLLLDKTMNALAKELYQQRSLLVMGRGYNFATCLEGALVSGYSHQE